MLGLDCNRVFKMFSLVAIFSKLGGFICKCKSGASLEKKSQVLAMLGHWLIPSHQDPF